MEKLFNSIKQMVDSSQDPEKTISSIVYLLSYGSKKKYSKIIEILNKEEGDEELK